MRRLLFVAIMLVASVATAEAPPQFILQWGSYGTNNGQFGGPAGIDIDSHGIVYVLDSPNYRVQKFDTQGNFLSSWPVIHGGNGLAIDSNDNVYIAGGWGGIWKFDSQGTILAPEWNFNAQDLTLDSNNNLFLASRWQIIKLDTDGNVLLVWGSQGLENGQFSEAASIAVDSRDNIYVGDGGYAHRVQVFDNNGNFLRSWGGVGSEEGQFMDPYGIAINSQDQVYVADYYNNRVQMFTSQGTFLTMWGSSWGSPGTGPGEFDRPQSITVGSDGSIYVCDEANYRIQKFGWPPVTVQPTSWSTLKTLYR